MRADNRTLRNLVSMASKNQHLFSHCLFHFQGNWWWGGGRDPEFADDFQSCNRDILNLSHRDADHLITTLIVEGFDLLLILMSVLLHAQKQAAHLSLCN